MLMRALKQSLQEMRLVISKRSRVFRPQGKNQ